MAYSNKNSKIFFLNIIIQIYLYIFFKIQNYFEKKSE